MRYPINCSLVISLVLYCSVFISFSFFGAKLHVLFVFNTLSDNLLHATKSNINCLRFSAHFFVSALMSYVERKLTFSVHRPWEACALLSIILAINDFEGKSRTHRNRLRAEKTLSGLHGCTGVRVADIETNILLEKNEKTRNDLKLDIKNSSEYLSPFRVVQRKINGNPGQKGMW